MDVSVLLGQLLVEGVYGLAQSVRCRRVVGRWLRRNSLELISSEERTLFQGPYSLTTGASDKVLRIEVRDAKGVVRKGFLCCREHTRGLSGRHHLDVSWD